MEINDELTSDLWEEVLDKGYSFRFKAFGVSMLPLIRAGDILTIKPVEYVDLSIGDIILYENNSKPFVHRIIKIRRLENSFIFITKGDFLRRTDQSIKSPQILGKLAYLERNGNRIHFNTLFMRIVGYIIALFYPLTYPILNGSLQILIIASRFKKKINKIFY